jgi:hypothetical protein
MDRHHRQIAFVLLDRSVPLAMQEIARAIRTRYPNLPVEVVAAAQNGASGAQSPLIRCGSEFVAVMNMPAPISCDPTEEIWVQAARTWPQAPAVATRHNAHIIVAVFGKIDNPLREARVVTAVVGGLLDTVPGCLGVMWAGRVARPAILWKDQSRAAFAPFPDYPIMLWIDIAPVRTAAGIDAVTIGLSSFVDREIEYEVGRADAAEVLAKVAGLAGYLIEHGNVVKDGDTFGGSDAERVRVKHSHSHRLAGAPILRVAADARDRSRDQ